MPAQGLLGVAERRLGFSGEKCAGVADYGRTRRNWPKLRVYLRALGARDDADISLLVSKFFRTVGGNRELGQLRPEPAMDQTGRCVERPVFVEERRRNELKAPAADTVMGAKTR